MTRDELLELLAYDRWADGRILSVAAKLPPARFTQVLPGAGSLRDLLVRLVSARMTWLARWRGRPAGMMLFASAFSDGTRLRERSSLVAVEIAAHFAALDDADFAAPFSYRTRSGREVALPLGHTVLHLVNQGAALRGQATLLVRQLGERGVHLDLATFLRERGRAAER